MEYKNESEQNVNSQNDMLKAIQSLAEQIVKPESIQSEERKVKGAPDFLNPSFEVLTVPAVTNLKDLGPPEEKKVLTSRYEEPSQFKPETTMYVPGHNPAVLEKGINDEVQKTLLGAGLEDMSQVHQMYKKEEKKSLHPVPEPVSKEPNRQKLVSTEQLSGLGRKELPKSGYVPYRPGT